MDYDRYTARAIRLVPRRSGPLRLWMPLRDGTVAPGIFVLGGDVSGGIGNTPSCLSIWNAETGEKVGEYLSAYIQPGDFAVLAIALCWLFKTIGGDGAKLAWERQGPGSQFGVRVIELGYRNVLEQEDADKAWVDQKSKSAKYGWMPTEASKLRLHGEYHEGLAKGLCTVRSVRSLKECLGFVHTKRSVDYPPVARG